MTLTGVAKSWPLTSLHHGALAQLALRCCPSHACYCLLPSHCPCTVASSPRLVLCQLPTGNLSQSHNSIWPPTPPTPQDQDSPLHCLHSTVLQPTTLHQLLYNNCPTACVSKCPPVLPAATYCAVRQSRLAPPCTA